MQYNWIKLMIIAHFDYEEPCNLGTVATFVDGALFVCLRILIVIIII